MNRFLQLFRFKNQPSRPFTTAGSMCILLIVCLLSVNIQGNAQTNQLSLKDAIQYALKANQTVRKAKLDVENSKYQVDEVRASALPQISGNGSITYNPILQLTALPGELAGQPGQPLLVAFGQKWNSSAGLSLSQSLYDQALFTGLKAAKTTEEFYLLNAQLSEEQIIEMVASAYYQLQVQKQKIQVLDSNYKNTSRVKEVLRGQFENGLAKKIDLDRVDVGLSNIEAQRQQLRNGINQAENRLKFLMGMPIPTKIAVPDVTLSTIKPELISGSESMEVEDRTEMQLLRKQSQLLTYQKKATKAESYPTLGLTSNYAYQGLGNNFPVGKGVSQGVNWFDYANIGVTLRVPIFKGGATRARIKQADVSIRKLDEDIANQSLSLSLEFENAKSQLSSSIIILNKNIAKRIQQTAARMRHLIDDLLSYSNTTLGATGFEVADLNEIINVVVEDMEVSIAELNGKVHINPLSAVKGDKRQLRQLFQNLIDNALKYRKKDLPPEIFINSAFVDGHDIRKYLPDALPEDIYHEITVKDNGIGFDPEDGARIFNLFYRLHKRDEYQGTGVGLAIVQKVVENHKGYILAEGVAGVGALFTIYLPANVQN